MNPSNGYIRDNLNKGGAIDTVYRSIAANFEPTRPSFKPWAKDKLMGRIFKEDNDLVVPTRGVYEANGDPMFPIAADNRLHLSGVDDVHHGNFFANAKLVKKLDEWLRI